MKIANRLKTLRIQKGICQKELAAHLHVSVSTISSYENGIHEPDIHTLVALADYYNVSTDYILEQTKYPWHPKALEKQLLFGYSYYDLYALSLSLTEAQKTLLTDILKLLDLS